ncbi:U3 small nucleolar ribonucleoprotein IMP4 [Astathelohania contejeani]|uniref:U3 small nucleolar ribonucleoprotein protein IMP4 n=1 Tax=Astathelohania contejeani TaxID=164912 RepID=A0ABQ7I1W9_9MICR|nr:U3 small nucleolar ribonucleoprotein IMP4 [Thelohania contejeani]
MKSRRERKEYLIRKEKEQKEKEIEKNKEIIKQAYENNQPIPHALRNNAASILNEIIYSTKDEDVIAPPRVLITTSRNPSTKLVHFIKQLALIIPNSRVLQRGSLTLEQLNEISNTVDQMVIVKEVRGVPSAITFSSCPYGPTFYYSLHNFFENGKVSNGNIYLITDGFKTDLGQRVVRAFSLLYPWVDHADKYVVLQNRNDLINFKYCSIEDNSVKKIFGFDLKLYEIGRGTFYYEGEKEWVYKPYLNTSRKREEL